MSFTIETGKETGLVQANVVPQPLVLCQLQAVNPATGKVDSGSDTVYLSTSADPGQATLVYAGNTYQARLKDNVIGQIQAQSAQGYDIPGSIELTIADGDFAIWTNHANAHGWRGGTLTVTFVLRDIPSSSYSTNAYVWPFIMDKPTIDGTGLLKVAGQARQSMTRLNVPNVPRQNRCSHDFPSTAAQRADGLLNPTSPYYACGYSPDQSGGVGNQTTPNLTSPDGSPLTDSSGNYVTCDYTRSCGSGKATLTQGCMARLGSYSGTLAADGDITKDTSNRPTARFDGDTWVAPVGYSGRQYVNPSAGKIYGFNTPNPPTGQTYYPTGYGTQWVNAMVLEPASDPNSYRAECIVCVAPIATAYIWMVLVNGVQVPQNGSDPLFSWRMLSAGGRNGAVNTDAIFNGQGDPHGSLCAIEIVVPAELQASGSIASVPVLVQFPQCLHGMPIATAAVDGSNTLLTFSSAVVVMDMQVGSTIYVTGNSGVPDGAYPVVSTGTSPSTAVISGVAAAGTGGGAVYIPEYAADPAMIDAAGAAAANPVWALMDLLLMWGPFTAADIDFPSWYYSAQVCAEQISYTDINNNSATHARYRCSFVLDTSSRQSLAKAVLGIRNCAGIILARNPASGQLQCWIEQTLADQQGSPIAGSNYNTPVSSLTAAGATANGYLAYLFDGAGSIEKGTLKIGGRTNNDVPNTISFPFQDSANQWVQDSLTMVDPNGYVSSGNQEIQQAFTMLGIENFDQGSRRTTVELAKAMYGNSRFDAGGSELITLRATAKAAHLASRVGYICGINYPQLSL